VDRSVPQVPDSLWRLHLVGEHETNDWDQ